MRPKKITYTLAALDADGYLNDATGTGPWTTMLSAPGDGMAHPVTIASTANLSTITFTVVGTDAQGNALTEDVTGPNNNTVTSTKYFKTLTSVTASATAGANTFDVGWTAAAQSPVYVINSYAKTGACVGVNLVSGSATFTAQQTNTPPFSVSTQSYAWVTLGSAGATATAEAVTNVSATAVRLTVASHTSGVIALEISQSRV